MAMLTCRWLRNYKYLDMLSEAMPKSSPIHERTKLGDLMKALNKLETRHRIAAMLKASLPAAAVDGPLKGALVSREEYVYLADGDARRYAKAERWQDAEGEWRSATSQGMPGDLRTKLLGWKLADKDGRKGAQANEARAEPQSGRPPLRDSIATRPPRTERRC